MDRREFGKHPCGHNFCHGFGYLLAYPLVNGLLLFAFGCLAPPLLQAQTPETKTDWALWVQKLGDPHFRQRELATQVLRGGGTEALPAIKAAQNDPDPELRGRARELASEIETKQLLEPKTVSVKLTNAPVKEVLDKISKQTGYQIDLWNPPNQTISIDCVRVPFWKVIDQVSEQAGLHLQQGYGDDRVRLNPNGSTPRYIDYSGPFRIAAQSLQQNKFVDLTNAKTANRTENLTLQYTVYSEPKMPILGLGEAKILAAFDADGNSLIPPVPINPNGNMGGFRGRSVSRYGNGYRMLSMQSALSLKRQNERCLEATLIRASVPANILVNQETISLSKDLLKDKGKKFEAGGFSIHMENVTIGPNGGLSIKMNIHDLSKDASDMTWMNSLSQRLEVRDEKGTKLNLSGSHWGSSGPSYVQMGFDFQPMNPAAAGKPQKFEFFFHQWKTLETQINFEFKNLPLP